MFSKDSWFDILFDIIYAIGGIACILNVLRYIDGFSKKQDSQQVINKHIELKTEQDKTIKKQAELITELKIDLEQCKKA